MPLFYFNFRDEAGVLSDETGAKYRSLEDAKTAAVKCLAELTGDQGAIPPAYSLVIEGRDSNKKRLFEVRLTLEVTT
jgi:hypothetical protein